MELVLKVDNSKYIKKYHLENIKEISLKQLERKILLKLTKDSLNKTVSIAKEVGLSDLTLDEINEEIKAVRNK